MDKWQTLDVLMNMRGVAIEMMAKHNTEHKHKQKRSDILLSMTRWDAWNDLEDKLHAKWKRLYNETVIERELPEHFLIM